MVTQAKAAERKARTTNRSCARKMRCQPVFTERLFWPELRDRKLGGFKFKRQHPIGNCIVDFVCLDEKLIVELDGGIHRLTAERDAIRDAVLQTQGYRVLHFRNEDVTRDLPAVLETVRQALERRTPSPRPSPPLRGGEGADWTRP